MRLSAYRKSPYWKPCALTAHVTLDGVQLGGVVEASEEDGWVELHVADDAGVLRVIGDHVPTYRLTGTVRIVSGGSRD